MPAQLNDRVGLPDEKNVYQELEYVKIAPAIFRSLIILIKRKNFILACSAVVAVLMAAIAFLIPNKYTATARILPPQNQQSSSATMLAGQLGPLAALLGGGGANKAQVDLYVGLAKSATVADQLIKDFNLKEVYRDKTLSDTREDLSDASDIFAGKDGIIVISVVDKNPNRAKDIADGYVKAVSALNERLARTEASQRITFYDSQLRNEKDKLVEAEVGLRKTQETTGVIQLSDQAKTIIEGVAKVRAMIAAKEVEIQTMKVFATDQNPQLLAAEEERNALRVQLTRMERNESAGGNGDLAVPTDKVPEAGLQYMRAYREVKYHEALFEMLAKQLESARIDEARDSGFVQVLDNPVVPDRKSAPHRGYIIVFGTFIGFLLMCSWVLMVENINRSAEKRRLLSELRSYLWSPLRQN